MVSLKEFKIQATKIGEGSINFKYLIEEKEWLVSLESFKVGNFKVKAKSLNEALSKSIEKMKEKGDSIILHI